MRVNTANSIRTANTVRERFGSWKAAKEAAIYEGGKFVVRSAANGERSVSTAKATPQKA